jgi:hypothetical protein
LEIAGSTLRSARLRPWTLGSAVAIGLGFDRLVQPYAVTLALNEPTIGVEHYQAASADGNAFEITVAEQLINLGATNSA